MIADRNRGRADVWEDVPFAGEDALIYGSAEMILRAERDIEAARTDPAYAETAAAVKTMLAEYASTIHDREAERYIVENMNSRNNEIRELRKEVERTNVIDITAEWVDEWHKRKQGKGSETREIRTFVTESFNEAEKQSAATSEKVTAIQGRSLIMRYIMAAAAVLAGAVIVITSLLHAGDPEKLFDKYYKPVHAISQVTRNMDTEISATWEDAVNSYNEGDYSSASEAFARLSAANPLLIPPRFYLGLSYLADGNYTGASKLLEEVADSSLDYSLEAFWYLGLIRLKAGDKEGASLYFDHLASGPGYYSERSAKILRRLK